MWIGRMRIGRTMGVGRMRIARSTMMVIQSAEAAAGREPMCTILHGGEIAMSQDASLQDAQASEDAAAAEVNV